MPQSRNKKLSFIIELLKADSASGILLIICVVVSLLLANGPLSITYNNILHFKTTIPFVHAEAIDFTEFINDGLMSIFFLFVGLEIKREIKDGQLSTTKQAALPVFAALGGIITPACIYTFFNFKTSTHAGWAIPTATDIAFAIAILSILGKKVKLSHKIFLKALAIVDDLGAIVIIMFFYSAGVNWVSLSLAFGVFALQFTLNRLKVNILTPYLLLGILLWYFIHKSGVHPTIAGVLTAFSIPHLPQNSLIEKLEHSLVNSVNFIIMPLFAMANTDIVISANSFNGFLTPIAAGIILGLVVGKPLGITLFTWLSVKLKAAALPAYTNYKQIAGLGILGGIGFTMSIFITLLSFGNVEIQNDAKLYILAASVIAAVAGYIVLNSLHKKHILAN
ncbi:Na+/H+ antiporter NhaA [Mucilaginibacter sp. KACC 22063]|uniref:Na+/H+ antiporter NhaA n=1 Tax=Mucilaginibacter sp. KACC 22063 TaxID=3025666 RepID=UPI002365B59F|nr:Na+/H+ antiporter NhaA [Mucilaginibacter sp. KACC 22063]WDF53373.1 Na+/H+ antiporter NhaA [Mucilaginibacter sp. KACC 22063]